LANSVASNARRPLIAARPILHKSPRRAHSAAPRSAPNLRLTLPVTSDLLEYHRKQIPEDRRPPSVNRRHLCVVLTRMRSGSSPMLPCLFFSRAGELGSIRRFLELNREWPGPSLFKASRSPVEMRGALAAKYHSVLLSLRDNVPPPA
jgi:hypothetical protein